MVRTWGIDVGAISLQELASFIKELRLSNGLSFAEFGERIGVSHANVRRWENGEHRISEKSLNKIFEVFNVGKNPFSKTNVLTNRSTRKNKASYVGDELLRFEKKYHLTTQDVALKLGVSFSSVQGWEKNKNPMNKKYIEQLCEEYDLPLEQWFGVNRFVQNITYSDYLTNFMTELSEQEVKQRKDNYEMLLQKMNTLIIMQEMKVDISCALKEFEECVRNMNKLKEK